jgi:hypothetical protein
LGQRQSGWCRISKSRQKESATKSQLTNGQPAHSVEAKELI